MILDGFVKNRTDLILVIPAKVLRRAQDRELVERPESGLFEGL